MAEKTKPIHYVDNKKFFAAMVEYINKCKAAEAAGLEVPKIPDYIGSCIYKIAEGLSYKKNFINYSFREEMMGDGIESCIKYLRSFKPEKTENAFSYFSQICFNAYIHRIGREKKEQYTKYKMMQRHFTSGMNSEDFQHLRDSGHNFEAGDNIISSFEASLEKKKEATRAKQGLEKFITENEDERDITTDLTGLDHSI